jgi:hypothetical protein
MSDDDTDKIRKISELIADLQSVKDQFGDSCVYIRSGGLSWGAVALNRRSDDEKHGVFDLQSQHDRDMLERLEQIERLQAAKRGALKIADERAKENEELRQQLECAHRQLSTSKKALEGIAETKVIAEPIAVLGAIISFAKRVADDLTQTDEQGSSNG